MTIQFTKRKFTVAVLATLATATFGLNAYAADTTIVRVGVVGDYNAQWDTVNKLLAKDNIKIKLVRYSDYATPNRALHDGEIELNAFQHKAFLANDIARNGYKIQAIGDTLVAPLRIYPNKKKVQSIKDFKKGDIIAIPSDLTNGGRALKLLESIGLIEVDPSKGFVPTKADITKYNVKIKIREAESGMLARILPDISAALINGGNAYTAGLDSNRDAIYEEVVDEKTNPNVAKLVNIIAARTADANNPVFQKIVQAYNTPEVAKTLREAYKGAFSAAWKGAKDYKF